MDSAVQTLNLSDRATFQAWQAFLTDLGITNFSDYEVAQIDATLGIYDEDHALVATGSTANNVLKYLGVCNKGNTQGSRFNTIVSALMSDRAQEGIFHLFVFTKPEYIESFGHIGFHVLAETTLGGLLETGDSGIDDYLATIPRIPNQANRHVAGIVMNANPFTNGHRYLVEQAAAANDWVYVFMVNDDVSLLTTAERTQLVQAGVADLTNVTVVSGGAYMVSYVTFPAYFLPDSTAAIAFQTTLDARLFKRWIAPALHITRRYLGSEPFSKTTGQYNQTLQKELPPEVSVVIMPRKTADDRVITATRVRQAIAANALATVETFLPSTTYAFITAHLAELQERIKKGMNIDGN